MTSASFTVRERMPAWYPSSVTSRTWQMLAAGASVALLIIVIAKYVFGENAPDSSSSQPHVGAKHFTEQRPAHEGAKLAPIQVYANAKVGDWRAYRVTTESSLAPTTTATVLTWISKATDKDVTRSFKGKVDASDEVRSNRDEERPREGLTIDQLTGNDVGGWTIYDLVITDDERTVGGLTFKCKKIGYSSDDPLIPNKKTRTEMWIAADVPAGGVVEQREVQEMSNMRYVQTQQLIGFGDATGARWGTKPEGLTASAP